MEIVVNDSEAFPGVVAPVSPAHQVLNNQAHINQSDLIVWRQMTLQEGTETKWCMRLNKLWLTSADENDMKWTDSTCLTSLTRWRRVGLLVGCF